jgi:hypothetical protein
MSISTITAAVSFLMNINWLHKNKMDPGGLSEGDFHWKITVDVQQSVLVAKVTPWSAPARCWCSGPGGGRVARSGILCISDAEKNRESEMTGTVAEPPKYEENRKSRIAERNA